MAERDDLPEAGSQAPRPWIDSSVTLRQPMDKHFDTFVDDDEEQDPVMTDEAILLASAWFGFEPTGMAETADGGVVARAAVECVLQEADRDGYDRVETLRMLVTTEPFGAKTMAAIEHMTEHHGVGVIRRGLAAAGVKADEYN